ncbi:MAG: tetraacyldisaccharide 4'-kinase [Thiohalocapsa sp.]
MSPDTLWYGGTAASRVLSALLAPLGWVYCGLSTLRCYAYRVGWFKSTSADVPVIVVGNLTVGGTGKTPLVLWLAARLHARGLRPGVAMRGHGASPRDNTALVPADGDPFEFGDEPVLLAARSGCPVVIGRDRVAAARRLAVEHRCDVIVTDDGLQHYRLRRDWEILVVDGMRQFGNGRCLPAGPLREHRRRARRADLCIVNGGADEQPMRMRLVPRDAVNLYDAAQRRPLDTFADECVTAVAGIGNPKRFFSMLRAHGLRVRERAFPDHHSYSAVDLARLPEGSVLMTEKDAVKCRAWATAEHWYLPVQAQPDEAFEVAFDHIIDLCRARTAQKTDSSTHPASRDQQERRSDG